MYNGHVQVNQHLFNYPVVLNGGLCLRHGIAMGGVWGFGLLGPDLMMPGGSTNNPPSASCEGWDQAWTALGRPALTFTENKALSWKRGHLVNGEWGGLGSIWNNLTPLTATANSNHKTVEQLIKNYLTASYAYERQQFRTHWYGVEYLVECSVAPWAHHTMNNAANLYAYAPAFIRVQWRAVQIAKPTATVPHTIPAVIPAMARVAVPALPFAFITPPVLIGAACLPALGNVAGGLTFASGQVLVAAQANGFDGQIEVHQS
jgi:hypothetical protein